EIELVVFHLTVHIIAEEPPRVSNRGRSARPMGRGVPRSQANRDASRPGWTMESPNGRIKDHRGAGSGRRPFCRCQRRWPGPVGAATSSLLTSYAGRSRRRDLLDAKEKTVAETTTNRMAR